MVARKSATRKKSKTAKAEAFASRTVCIINKYGLHARPAALFVQTANKFPKCRITVTNGTDRVNGKSIMGMMTLAAAYGTELTIEAAGPEAKAAVDALCRLIEEKFGEE